jgi:hypothetical protein
VHGLPPQLLEMQLSCGVVGVDNYLHLFDVWCDFLQQFQDFAPIAPWPSGLKLALRNARTSRKKLIVALTRKLLIASWQLAHDGVVPEGVVLRPAH